MILFAYLQTHATVNPPLPVLVVGIGFLLFMVAWGVPAMISRMTGWSELAERFTAQGPFRGLTWSFQSAQMRYWGNYNNCLTVGANTQGLYLKVPFFLGRHPQLFIPWTEISATRIQVLFWPMVRLDLGRDQHIPFKIRKQLADRVKEAAGSGWPVEQLS